MDNKLRACIPLLLAAALLVAAAANYGVVNSQSGNGKYDTDGDRLIEIEYLEQLDAIRYDLDGFGEWQAGDTGRRFNGALCVGFTSCLRAG